MRAGGVIVASALCAIAVGAGCRAAGTFQCQTADQCRGAGPSRCEPTGFCSFVDPGCSSGSRYDRYAGNDLSSQCVPTTTPVVDAPRLDGTSPPPFCDPGDPTLIACYELEDTLADGSVHHLDPNVAINASFAAGKVGRALVVSPTTEVDVAESALFGTSAMTIEAWIDPVALPTAGKRAGILDCDGRYGFFLHPNGDLQCTTVTATAVVQAARWTHVACTNDGATARIYVDGSVVATAAATPLPLTGSQSGITLGGNNPPGGGDPLNGALDQVRLFKVARTPAQLCAAAGRTTCP